MLIFRQRNGERKRPKIESTTKMTSTLFIFRCCRRRRRPLSLLCHSEKCSTHRPNWSRDPLQCQTHALSNSINVKWLHICEYNSALRSSCVCWMLTRSHNIYNNKWIFFFFFFHFCPCFFFSFHRTFWIAKLKPVKFKNVRTIRWNRIKYGEILSYILNSVV